MEKKQIELTNLQMLRSYSGLNYLVNKELSAPASYRLNQNKNKIDQGTKEYNDFREKVFDGHCEVDENGKIKMIKGANGEEEVKFLDKEHQKIVSDSLDELNNLKNTFELWTMNFEDLKRDPNALELYGSIWTDLFWLLNVDD